MRGRRLASLLLLALLAGCSAGGDVSGGSGPAGLAGSSAPEVEVPEEPDVSQETETPPADPLFSTLPETFYFSSGAGGWGTELILEDDGSFRGEYHDSDMGDQGENYPNGTKYRCQFWGKFSPPEQVDVYTWSTHVEELEMEGVPGTVTYEEGVRYIDSEPYGLNDVDEVLIYLPGLPKRDAPDAFISWSLYFWGGRNHEFTAYGLYNVNGEQGFVGSLD